MMPGDQYNVYLTCFTNSGTHAAVGSPVHTWDEAKKLRDGVFTNVDVQSCWIMVTNPSLGCRPVKRGYTKRRRRGEP